MNSDLGIWLDTWVCNILLDNLTQGLHSQNKNIRRNIHIGLRLKRCNAFLQKRNLFLWCRADSYVFFLSATLTIDAVMPDILLFLKIHFVDLLSLYIANRGVT